MAPDRVNGGGKPQHRAVLDQGAALPLIETGMGGLDTAVRWTAGLLRTHGRERNGKSEQRGNGRSVGTHAASLGACQ
jgi:hypothetical protein